MAAIQRGITYTYKKAFSGHKWYTGFDYTITNSEEDAKANNRDVIRIEPFTMKETSDGTNWESLTWTNVDIQIKYNGVVYKTGTCTRRFRIKNYGSNNVKYYFKQVDPDYNSNGDTWSGSHPTQNAIGINGRKVNGSKHVNTLEKFGSHTNRYSDNSTETISGNYGLTVTLPHNDDGTPIGNVNVVIGSNRSAGYGIDEMTCKPSGTFELPKIDRGTKIWVYDGSHWNKTATVHLKGEASGEQHYIYKYNGSSWVQYYG